MLYVAFTVGGAGLFDTGGEAIRVGNCGAAGAGGAVASCDGRKNGFEPPFAVDGVGVDPVCMNLLNGFVLVEEVADGVAEAGPGVGKEGSSCGIGGAGGGGGGTGGVGATVLAGALGTGLLADDNLSCLRLSNSSF